MYQGRTAAQGGLCFGMFYVFEKERHFFFRSLLHPPLNFMSLDDHGGRPTEEN